MTETKATIVFREGAQKGATVRVYQCQKQWDELQLSGHDLVLTNKTGCSAYVAGLVRAVEECCGAFAQLFTCRMVAV